jgi:hypothetical protein
LLASPRTRTRRRPAARSTRSERGIRAADRVCVADEDASESEEDDGDDGDDEYVASDAEASDADEEDEHLRD